MKLMVVFFPGFLLSAAVSLENLKQMRLKVPSCITPNNHIGECIDIKNCLVFINSLKSGKNESFDFIRASQCGPHNQDPTNPKVCCGTHNNYLIYKTKENKPMGRIPERNLFPKTCGIQDDNEHRLFGGTHADFGEFPWMARLRHLRSDGLLSYGCVGFLISETFVLTAAHCIISKILAPLGPIYQVQLGEYNMEIDLDCQENICIDQLQFLETAEPIVHPEYIGDSQFHNDIAVIPLKEPAKFTEYVFPICLPKRLSQETLLWISGWGTTETKRGSPKKLKTNLPRVNKVQCTSMFRPIGITILDSQVCAGGEAGRDACSGDSGGPLMVLSNSIWYAEGIVSFGKGCGEKGWPGIYTSIPYYMPWIKQVMNQYLMGDEERVNVPGKTKTEEPVRWIW